MKKTVLDSSGIKSALERMADEIIGRAADTDDLALVGIRTGGAFLVKRLQVLLQAATGRNIPVGVIDISLYRDDWTRIGQMPLVGKTDLNFSIDDKRLILIDDVLFTGRTVRSALGALMDYGRPSRIELAVLVDRGHRELPIAADYCGVMVETELAERVNVYFAEQGDEDEVAVEGL